MGFNARGVVAIGLKAKGIVSLGAIALGDFSVGALAVGKYFAFGDNARAMIAVGNTQAAGSAFQKTGELTAQDITTVNKLLDTTIPTSLLWAKADN